ncbi:MAG: NADH-quinone oxidoreductase subunit A [Gammaproteobacteria bacterium]|nr:NADH-quinone oxidoreductase subunit A [Gammaproteobacteria bacterium]
MEGAQAVSSAQDLTSFVIYAAAVVAVVGTMLGLSFVLGQRKSAHSKNLPFESGIVSVGSAQFHTTIHFYLPAILFIIFDLEVVFLFSWAVVVREAGWAGFIEISVFIVVLLVALFYLWRIGALDWRTQIQKRELKTLVGPGGVTNRKEFRL